MHRIRITALPNSGPSKEVRQLAILRRDLYGHSPVEIDPDNPAHRTQPQWTEPCVLRILYGLR